MKRGKSLKLYRRAFSEQETQQVNINAFLGFYQGSNFDHKLEKPTKEQNLHKYLYTSM